jgi:hypothetical protein
MTEIDRRPSREEFHCAVEAMGAIPYFPTGEVARAAIATNLEQFIDSFAGLRWIIAQSTMHMRKWDGIAELRGIYCAGGFKPADGMHERTSLPTLLQIEEPPYYKPYKALLPPPPLSPAEEDELQAGIQLLEAKQAEYRREKAMKTAKEVFQAEEYREWLRRHEVNPT